MPIYHEVGLTMKSIFISSMVHLTLHLFYLPLSRSCTYVCALFLQNKVVDLTCKHCTLENISGMSAQIIKK